ncbi:MAG: MBL fold metallo-hydrolase [Deltaproteobacteria bacterium]|nr:MBL fold metallo-hydrolase [Deltaproteobacteria bacterium]MBI3388730.1 MBL fold metallo-hydrolase [Deltaproteobacteria bacterium]
MRRVIFWVIGIGLAAGAVGAIGVRVPAVQDFVMRRVIARRMSAPPTTLLGDDALRVLLCGTSSPMPHPTRAKACVAVFAAGRFWVVDTGLGSWNRLAQWQVDGRNIGGILLTHFHSDHIGELGEFNLQTWAAGRPGPLRVFGPPGVERVVAGFTEAYALDSGYRTAHHGAALLPPDVGRLEAVVIAGPAEGAGPTVVVREGGLTITAFAVNHQPVSPAYGYRFDYQGRSVVVSGDTVKDAGLIAVAKGADVLVHEAQANHIVAMMREEAEKTGRTRIAKILHDIPSYHTSPVQAAEAANEAGVKFLVLYHLTPPPPVALVERAFVRGIDAVRPRDWVLADDGLLVTLPVGSNAIDVGRID